MTRQKITYLLFLTLLLSTLSFSQNRSRTTIVENVNATKAGLVHVLNRTGDTIILKSSKEIFRFSFLYHTQKESVLMDLGSKEAKIPLHHFEVGRYTVVAYREDAVYPISMDRIEVISKPQNAIVDLEEDILRSSLPEEEQRKRNIKPREKNQRDTRLANVNSRPDRSKIEAEEREKRERIRRQAEETAKKEQALAEANREKLEQEKAERERAQIEANRKAIKERALAEAKQKEEKARALAEAERKRAKAEAIAENQRKKEQVELDKKVVKYNITDVDNGALEKQSREEYRKENLRPNGKKYDEALEEERKNRQ
ncbi:hypothetical protein [Olleya aquimaris]|uniref:Uncharacterized protein n=1 Tax=Olleya aquimaris TaxID=639310 RepID=A0A327R8X0_9FLAO|nr:hypothetical protein [Olleya aquimaris]RAJ13390.1 hypothetical protein LY08_01907 [Olleya aquimaris]